jgi:hypothetical protein
MVQGELKVSPSRSYAYYELLMCGAPKGTLYFLFSGELKEFMEFLNLGTMYEDFTIVTLQVVWR